MMEEHMEIVVEMVDRVLMNIDDESIISSVRNEVKAFMRQFPLMRNWGKESLAAQIFGDCYFKLEPDLSESESAHRFDSKPLN